MANERLQNQTDRSVSEQAYDAGRELSKVLVPAVVFGLAAAVLSIVIGSVMFSETWVTALLVVVTVTCTTAPIVLERVHTLGSMEGPA